MKIIHQTLIIVSAFFTGYTAHSLLGANKAESFKAVRIVDGDTLIINDSWKSNIRLNAIDTPERGKLYYAQATQKLEALCSQTDITLKNRGDGGYGRISADVYCDGVFVNTQMIKAGLAIVSIKYAKDAALYDIQDKARQSCREIWSQDIRKIYDEEKLRATAPSGEIVQITNNPDCKIKLASN